MLLLFCFADDAYKIDGVIVKERTNTSINTVIRDLKLTVPDNKIYVINGVFVDSYRNNNFHYDVTDGRDNLTIDGSILFDSQCLFRMTAKNTRDAEKNFNFRYRGSKIHDGKVLKNEIELTHGNDPVKNNLTATFGILRNFYDFPYNVDRYFVYSFSYPLIETKTSVAYVDLPKLYERELKINYKTLDVGVGVVNSYNRKIHGDYDFKMDISGFANIFSLRMKKEVVDYGKYRIEHSVRFDENRVEIAGDVKYIRRHKHLDANADLNIKITGHPNNIR